MTNPLEHVESLLEQGHQSEAIALLCDALGCDEETAKELADALTRDTPSLADVKLLKAQQWTIRACLSYRQIFGDGMLLTKKIVDHLGDPLPTEKIENLLMSGEAVKAALQIRLYTGVGPNDAAKQVERTQLALVESHLALGRAQGIRAYSRIHGCSLSEAKKTLDALSS